jgi:hypothetical protein
MALQATTSILSRKLKSGKLDNGAKTHQKYHLNMFIEDFAHEN